MKRAMNVAAAGGATSKMFASLQVWDAAAMTLIGSRPLCVAPHGVTTTRDDKTAFDMSPETAEKALALVFRSPSPNIKIEFQGGEPLLNFTLERFPPGLNRLGFPKAWKSDS